MMSVLPPQPLGRDSPMSIERIAPASQFQAQSANNLLQNVQNDRRSTAVTDRDRDRDRDRDERDNGARDDDRDGGDDDDVEMPSLLHDNNRHPPSTSSAYSLFSFFLSLFLFFSFFLSFFSRCFFLSFFGFGIWMDGWMDGWMDRVKPSPHPHPHLRPHPQLLASTHIIIASSLLPFRSVPCSQSCTATIPFPQTQTNHPNRSPRQMIRQIRPIRHPPTHVHTYTHLPTRRR